MTPDEIAASLRPIRVPAEFMTFNIWDAFVFLIFGLLVGWLIFLVIARLRKPELTTKQKLARELEALRPLDRESQSFGIIQLWQEFGSKKPLPKSIQDGLYDPNATFNFSDYEKWLLGERE